MNIDWFITRKCDQAKFCQFCYAPWNFFPEDISIDKALTICKRFSELKVETVTLCGGEPFMSSGLDIIIEDLYKRGIKIVLYTNGTSDNYDLFSLLPKIHFLSLPIDAYTPKIIENMRGTNQFKRVSQILKRLEKERSEVNIKIGTVVTKENIDDLEQVYNYLKATKIVNVWRLYQFSPYGLGETNKERYQISDEEFTTALLKIEEINRQNNNVINLSSRTRNNTTGYCMIMDSSGNFYRYEERYIPLGITIRDKKEKIVDRYDISKHISQKKWNN